MVFTQCQNWGPTFFKDAELQNLTAARLKNIIQCFCW